MRSHCGLDVRAPYHKNINKGIWRAIETGPLHFGGIFRHARRAAGANVPNYAAVKL